MNWEDLRHFLALAEAGSLSEAARRLKVDHTTVARRIAGLEAALGLRLVERRPRALTLSADGLRIADLGQGMADRAFAILRLAQGVDSAPHGLVRVSAPPALAAVVLAPRLAGLRHDHPGLVVDLIGEQHAANLGRREADIAVRLSRPAGDSLVCRKVGQMALALYASPAYARGRMASDWDLLAHDGVPADLPQQRWLDVALAGRPAVFRASDLMALAAAARAGIGVAVLPRFLGDGDPQLTRLDSPVPPPRRDIWTVIHADLHRAPRIRAVLDWLAAALAG